MVELARLTRLLENAGLRLGRHDDEKKTLVFERAGLLFMFNFHPDQSYPDYDVPCQAGTYRLMLDSDAPAFCGHGRLPLNGAWHSTGTADKAVLRVYLPARTALVMQHDRTEEAAGKTVEKST